MFNRSYWRTNWEELVNSLKVYGSFAFVLWVSGINDKYPELILPLFFLVIVQSEFPRIHLKKALNNLLDVVFVIPYHQAVRVS